MYIQNMTLKYYSVTEKILRLSIIYIKQASTFKKKPKQKSPILSSLIYPWPEGMLCPVPNDQNPLQRLCPAMTYFR